MRAMASRQLNLYLVVILSTAVSFSDCQIVSPEYVAVATGTSITLQCTAPDQPTSISWLKGSTAVRLLNDSRIQLATSQLTITQFQGSHHSGEYSCLVELENGDKILSCPAKVSHAMIPAGFAQHPQPTSVTVGSSAVLQCHTHPSTPPADIHWTRDGLVLNDSRYSVVPSGNMYIVNVTQGDAGMYMCVATNPVTQAKRQSQTASLMVKDVDHNATEAAPTFTITPHNTTATLGDRVVLECAGSGLPWPTVEWTHHSQHFPHDGRVMSSGALVLEAVTLSDAGRYQCTLRNDVGEVSVEVHLDVREPPRFTNSLPATITLAEGETSTFSCHVTGSGPIVLSLYLNGVLLYSMEEMGSELRLTHPLMPLHQSHSGIYECLATNDVGCAHMEVSLRVSGGEGTTTESPVTTELPSTVSPMTIRMSPSESPVTTELPTTESPLTTRVLSTESPVTDIIGSGDPLITTATENVPPLDVMIPSDKLFVQEGDSATLMCKARGGGEGVVISWHFQGEVVEGSHQLLMEDGYHHSYLLLTTALAGNYTCNVSSSQSGQRILATIQVIVEAAPPTRPGPPSDVVVDDLPAPCGLIIQWKAPEEARGIRGYKLSWGEVGRDAQSGRVALSPSTTSHCIPLHTLDSTLPYVVLVWAYSLLGDGPAVTLNLPPLSTQPPTTTTTTVPLPQVCTASLIEDSVLLSWKDLFPTFREGQFLISYHCSEANVQLHLNVSMATTHVFRDGSLLPSCNYSFEVQSLTSGELASCVLQTQPWEVDIDVEVERLGNGSVKLQWTIPHGLEDGDITIYWEGVWLPIQSGLHIAAHFDPSVEYNVLFRLSHHKWTGYRNVIISPISRATTPTSKNATPTSGQSVTELSFIYGMIIGVIIIACIVVVLVILGLKYVQMSRRDEDKVLNHRDIHREEFKRLSLKRSSTSSTKRGVSATSSQSTDI